MAASTLSSNESQPPASVTPSYRRNGKLFSCEPCRRGKLRCDHASPICGRCARRNKPDQCIYHPAPLTKPRHSSESQQRSPQVASPRASITRESMPVGISPLQTGLASPPQSTTPSLQSRDTSSLPPSRTQSVGRRSAPQSPSQILQSTPLWHTERSSSTSAVPTESTNMSFSSRDSKTGFLGPTSYNAVFAEHPGSLSVIDEMGEDSLRLEPVSPERFQQGAEVLSMLRDIPIYQRFTQRFFDISDGIVVTKPIYQVWVEGVWSEFGRLLQEGDPDQLRSLSELVWRNTRRPMKVSAHMTAREWAQSATGKHLRWEVVGVILSLVGLYAVNLSTWDSIFDSIRERYVDRATFTERMRKAAEYCACFCYVSEVLNDIYVCFMYQDLVMLECMKGDAHYMSWQRTGEVIDAIVAMGLHQGNPMDAETPFFLSELRKKVFTAAYGRDKQVATFLGRPPRLSHRYCKMELPLDLSDDDLFLEGAALAAKLATLDADGWNTEGRLHRATWQRVHFQNSRIREDILEIALGSEEDDITAQIERVRLKLERLNKSYPDFMWIKPEDLWRDGVTASGYNWGNSEKSVRQVNAMFLWCIHAGMAQTEFLLQRALVNRKRTDTKELIPISRRLLELVLLAQQKRDYFHEFQGDLVYLMAMYGLPAAGVLAIELLKQEQSRQYTPEILPRSETIQDLSVMISALASVNPDEGNYHICNQGRRAIKRVLDQILSPNPGGMVQGADPSAPVMDDMSFYFPTGNDVDFLAWLENVEWDKPTYMGSGPSSQEAALM